MFKKKLNMEAMSGEGHEVDVGIAVVLPTNALLILIIFF